MKMWHDRNVISPADQTNLIFQFSPLVILFCCGLGWTSPIDRFGLFGHIIGLGLTKLNREEEEMIILNEMMASSVLGWISPKSLENSRFCCKLGAHSMSTSIGGSKLCAKPMMSTDSRSMRCSVNIPIPWLMLPPVFEGGDMIYKFYSLDDRIKSFRKRRDGVDLDQLPPDGARFVGSSHGWLALFDENSNHLFLSNPVSGRNIKLPPIDTPAATVFRVILSCSPDDEEEECRAMMTFCYLGRPLSRPGRAFCVPGVSTEWTLFGDQTYEDLVYCSRRKAFSCITPTKFEFAADRVRVGKTDWRNVDYQIDEWNVEDHLSPVMADATWLFLYEGPPPSRKENGNAEFLKKQKLCLQRLHLVCVEQSDVPFVVVRFMMEGKTNAFGFCDTCETVGFVVVKIEKEGRGCISVVEDLNGLALFVGTNHSFTIPAAEFSGILKPNSIYFTDPGRNLLHSRYMHANDFGIFDYENKTFSRFPLSYDHALPMWFTPNPN